MQPAREPKKKRKKKKRKEKDENCPLKQVVDQLSKWAPQYISGVKKRELGPGFNLN